MEALQASWRLAAVVALRPNHLLATHVVALQLAVPAETLWEIASQPRLVPVPPVLLPVRHSPEQAKAG